MSAVIVTDADGQQVTYDGATGINYDDRGFAAITRPANPEDPHDKEGVAVAVWAPGSWRHADVREDQQA